MSTVTPPLFTAARDGRRLRAFAAEGLAPELPWLSLADLAAALATTRDDEVELLSSLAGGAYALRLRTVATEDGPVVLVDQPGACLLLQFIRLLEDGPATLPAAEALLEDALTGGIVTAISALAPDDAARWQAEAWKRGTVAIKADVDRYRREAAGRG